MRLRSLVVARIAPSLAAKVQPAIARGMTFAFNRGTFAMLTNVMVAAAVVELGILAGLYLWGAVARQ